MPFQITSRLVDRRSLVRTREEGLSLARRMLRIGSDGQLLGFSIAVDHVHAGVAGDRSQAGRYARKYEAAFTLASGRWLGFDAADIRPFVDADHEHAWIQYCFRQPLKHGIVGDPLGELGCGLDLLLIRLVDPNLAARVKEWLPGLERSDIVRFLAPLREGTDGSRLAETWSVVSGGLPLDARCQLAARVRGAVVRAGIDLRVPPAYISEQLGVARSSVHRVKSGDDPVADRAARLALGLLQDLAPHGLPNRIELPRRLEMIRDSGGKLRTQSFEHRRGDTAPP